MPNPFTSHTENPCCHMQCLAWTRSSRHELPPTLLNYPYLSLNAVCILFL
ncbi:hypothetical protein NC653_021180 [Populus alba x Populus x berolinensis]|uniref:Uncharacterized protein n=1 Tax=Populus alba x Populus x berolinensis TaxID=444605 RepID=A0AAD6MMY1_9ROSI|nr:hypothetical protein NC653_021180 [Populus alba x Populus x berolinensis]